jgi:hypothetical protein
MCRNCAFNSSAHQALLSPESIKICIPPSTVEAPSIDILPYLLLPVAGPEELDLEVRALSNTVRGFHFDHSVVGPGTFTVGSAIPSTDKDKRT